MLRRPTHIRHSPCPVALSAVVWIIFHHDLDFTLKRPTENLTEAIHYQDSAAQKSFRMMLYSFGSLIKNLFTLATLKKLT